MPIVISNFVSFGNETPKNYPRHAFPTSSQRAVEEGMVVALHLAGQLGPSEVARAHALDLTAFVVLAVDQVLDTKPRDL